MKKAKLLITVFCLMIFVTVDAAMAAEVKLWDTKVKSNGIGSNLDNSAGWANKANWYHVPYGKTDYVFEGDAIIDNGVYWVDFYGGANQRPAMAGNINGEVQTTSEIYGVRKVNGSSIWNVWNNLKDSLKINELLCCIIHL